MAEIHVCQSGSCQRRGSEAVLLEIEDLARFYDGFSVKASGCLGMCNRAPAAVVVQIENRVRVNQRRQDEDNLRYFTRIDTINESIKVVAEATGKEPSELKNNISLEQSARLAASRAIRTREHALSIYRWNGALQATTEQLKYLKLSLDPKNMPRVTKSVAELNAIFRGLSIKAGFSPSEKDSVETILDMIKKTTGDEISKNHQIANYSRWTLEGIKVVSKHSAIFCFRSKDLKRGTPHSRGGGRPPPAPKTWHTTLLAMTANDEGPLPWIERDYTPISTSKEWEQGKCDILIKIYNDGAATSWLHSKSLLLQYSDKAPLKEPMQVWLSQPLSTLHVPSLVSTTSGSAEAPPFVPASVLLVLGGTGVVALPQILHHRSPTYKLGIPTKRTSQLHVPIDLVLSCRNDDVLMLPEVIESCKEAVKQANLPKGHVSWITKANITKGIRNCSLLLTSRKQQEDFPFPEFSLSIESLLDELNALPNASVFLQQAIDQRLLNIDFMKKVVSNLSRPYRIVVSGPSGFNSAVREMLSELKVDEESITILAA